MDRKLGELLDEYFGAGVAEGKEGRDHDTEDGLAQRLHHEIGERVKELIQAERAACAKALIIPAQTIRLHCGELNTSEMQGVQVTLRWVRESVLGVPDPKASKSE